MAWIDTVLKKQAYPYGTALPAGDVKVVRDLLAASADGCKEVLGMWIEQTDCAMLRLQD